MWITWFITRNWMQRTMLKQKLELEYTKKQITMSNETILSIARTVDAKDTNTSEHSYRVSEYSVAIAKRDVYKRQAQRSKLGAVQNRLEHTIANLDTAAENTQTSESRIRDTDMASEMVVYSKNNILLQAGQSMLAQANQSNQGVLSLLQ